MILKYPKLTYRFNAFSIKIFVDSNEISLKQREAKELEELKHLKNTAVVGIASHDLKISNAVTGIKTVWDLWNDRRKDRWDRMRRQEIALHHYRFSQMAQG